jgi:Arc/MetJ-type ribon-helix-helix transcriptional regulator
MISVQLTEDLEYFINEAVRTGRYGAAKDVIADALVRLRNAIGDVSDRSGESSGAGKKLTKQEFQRHLVKIGLLDHPPETAGKTGGSGELIDDEGEIVDEVVIRERLIEWLTGFL